MDLTRARTLGLVLILFCPGILFGADTTIVPPDPANLPSDWWIYFSETDDKAGSGLEERITTVTENLAKKKQSLSNDEIDRTGVLIDAVIANIKRHGQLTEAKPPEQLTSPVTADAYTIDELLGITDQLRKSRLELDLADQEVAQLDTIIQDAQRQLSKKKVAYQDLPRASAERLEAGLNIMQARLLMETARVEMKWKREHIASLEKHVNALKETLALAADHITANEKEIQKWASNHDASEKRAKEEKSTLVKAQLDASGLLLAGSGNKEQLTLARQRIMYSEVKVALADVAVITANSARILLNYFTGTGEPDMVRDRLLKDQYFKELKGLDKQFLKWEKQTYRSRVAALELIAETSDTDLLSQLKSRIEAIEETDEQLRKLADEIERTRQLLGFLGRVITQRSSYVDRSVAVVGNVVKDSWGLTKSLITESLFEINETPVTLLGIIRVLVILTVAWWLSKLIRTAIMRVGERRKTFNASALYTLGRVIHYLVLIVGVIIGLSSIGIDFTKFALFASALGIGIGFSLQTLISNLVAGLMILFEKSLKVGDFVELENGVTGEVREINMRSTLITTNDNIDILVPNSVFVNGQVTNWTLREAYRRIHVSFGVAYGTDKELVKKAALEAAEAVHWTLQGDKRRKSQVWFVEFGNSSLNFELVVWLTPDAVKRPGAVNAAYLWEIESKLAQHGIEVPFPQRDLHLRSIFGHKDDAGAEFLSNSGTLAAPREQAG